MPAASTSDPLDTMIRNVSVGIATGITNNYKRGDQNPVLVALAADPMAVLGNYGMDMTLFNKALPDVLGEYVNTIKAEAAAELQQARSARNVPRTYSFWRCWACRIGLGAALAIVGLAITVATAGAGGAIFIAAVNFMVVAGIAMLTAEGIMVAAVTAGGIIKGVAIAALVNFICKQIPNTCA